MSYNSKHNEANGEDNQDGANDNSSWNCGWEGETDDPGIISLRTRQMKNAVTMLMVSQGVPMILAGDEFGQSKFGNNNTYCHDNELNWLDWNLKEANADLFRFFKNIVAFRKAHPVLRSKDHLRHQDYVGSGYADISWHGTRAWNSDWGGQVIAFLLCGKHAKAGTAEDNYVYVAMNMYWETLAFELPGLPENMQWHVSTNTDMPTPQDIFEPGTEPILADQASYLVGGRSVVILVGR